ncbi:MAG: S8 family serine peptidase [Dehalococcoidia bacterium]
MLKSHSGLKRAGLSAGALVFTLAIISLGSEVITSASGSPVSIEDLADNPKLNSPSVILKDFYEGEPFTRVIVNLSKPTSTEGLPAPGTPGWLDSLRNKVSRAQQMILDRVDPAQVKVTNRFDYVFAFSAEVTLPGLQNLLNQSDVTSVDPDRIREADLAQGIALMNATTVRNAHAGSGMAIAICDTGIDYTHPQLGNGGFPNGKVIGGWDCGDNDNDPMDGEGHGTSCSGIAAGSLFQQGSYMGGVAHEAKLYAVKISFGTGGSAYDSDMIEGWEWCLTHQYDDPDHPIMIISTSFGGGRFSSICDDEVGPMTAAAANAVAAGITLFSSSGNDGYCDSIGWPACISNVISVGAVYDANFGRNPPDNYVGCISKDSCVAGGPPPNPCNPKNTTKWYVDYTTNADLVPTYSNTASILDLLAPANWATTTLLGGGFDTEPNGFGGTSASCPYAAGAAACLQTAARELAGRYLTPDEVRSYLVNTGSPVTDPKVAITKPRIDLEAAFDAMVSDLVPTEYTVDIYVNLQGANRPFPAGWEVPIRVGFFPANSGTLVMSGSESLYWFEVTTSGTVTESGTRAWFQCPAPVSADTYDITADSETTLLNVKRNVSIP